MAGLVLDSSIALSWCLPDEGAMDQIQQEVAGLARSRRRTGRSKSLTHC
jgi:hypothetical protein